MNYSWEHIRNSIAHGNVYLDIFRGDFTTSSAAIKFQDIHQNQKSFELELSAGEFNSLSNDQNIGQILKFLGDNPTTYTEEYKPKQSL